MARQRIITLTTDFGWQEGYVASMKGVILSARPDAQLIDVTHEIPPGDVLAGGFALAQVFDYFPAETVHLVVVDPGVGGERRILAAQYDGRRVVCPDNGLVTLLERGHTLEAIASVRNADYFLSDPVGTTFAGRDIMAPVAAALAGGTALAKLGPVPETYIQLELPEPTWAEPVLAGQVIHVDRFGNCISNIAAETLARHLPKLAEIVVSAGGQEIGPLRAAYTHVEKHRPVTLLNSLDRLEVAVNLGSAAETLGLSVGSQITARYRS